MVITESTPLSTTPTATVAPLHGPGWKTRLKASLWRVTKGRGLSNLWAFARLADRQAEMAANVSLQAHLARIGFTDQAFFVDGAAASATLQLILSKALSLCQPHNILELGSGQTTKVLAHYAQQHPKAQVLTLEEDRGWHQLFAPALPQIPNHRYIASPLSTVQPPGAQWYLDAPTLLAGHRFDLILVDGPSHHTMGDVFVPMSRSGVLAYLPQMLTEHFVIIFDDTDNYGKAMTAHAAAALLRRTHAVTVFEIHGVKSHTVICSPASRFLRSV